MSATSMADRQRPLLKRLVPTKQMKEWYVGEKKSSPEICELIRKIYGFSYTRQAIHKYLKKIIETRSQKESMRVRVYKGRIDHNSISKKIDYKNRNIDYPAIRKDLGYKWAIGLNDLLCWAGSVKELAFGIGCSKGHISVWRHLRGRVAPNYQRAIAQFYGIAEEKIFLDEKDWEVPKFFNGRSVDRKTRLRNLGWRYPAACVKQLLYDRREQTMKDFAKALGIKESRPYLAEKLKGRVLMTPKEQILTSGYLNEPLTTIFPDYDPIALKVFAESIEDSVDRGLAVSIINCELWKD